ncbi:hypothetical protein KAR91_01990 [Candidatus Pacearchaeota archaeon]|nr:hypothetical protein [Candidatus Pacearchaeota archaeon]
MMSDTYFNKMIDFALCEYETLTPEQLRRQVGAALRDVERETRHKASELTYKLANDIHNIRHEG